MKIEETNQQVVIYVNSTDQWDHRPLYAAIVQKCQELGLRGATVIRCTEGYGTHHHLHTARLLGLSESLPVRIEVVDLPERTEPLLAALGAMVESGMVTVSDVRVLRFVRDPESLSRNE